MEPISPKSSCKKRSRNKEELEAKLSSLGKCVIDLRMNDNRSTFLSILEKKGKKFRLSLHKMFLHASDNVLEAVIRFCVDQDKSSLRLIKAYAEKEYSDGRYHRPVALSSCIHQGKTYNLKEIFEEVCIQYFQKILPIHITYFRRPLYKKISGVTFGTFDYSRNLIRINALLDDPFYPRYFVAFVIYHEILHYIYPVQQKSQKRIVHGKPFREMEKKFVDFVGAKQFEKKLLTQMISRIKYVRT
ncbi:MAG: hypothetical protein JW769_00790 [Parachlamydiales bacterium]|nr:hypothetical protein [Parachlamydiales bacterium]